MHIHILGICGTFMGGLALIARALDHTVTGSDANVYPPMSTQLTAAGIQLFEGYDSTQLQPSPDCVIIGNALSRGNNAVEATLNLGLPYMSGPQWLADHVLCQRWVLAAAGTHGKTTTASMLTWILDYAGLDPGFLIGGIPHNFGISARLGSGKFFVIEADEYDTAFFDKRSKFVHYRPRTAILNNLEFDHADIFTDLAAIQRQFHNFIRTIPGNGLVILPEHESALTEVLNQGCWTPVVHTRLSDGNNKIIDNSGQSQCWAAEELAPDSSRFQIKWNNTTVGEIDWSLTGQHNVKNALSAIAAAHHAGVDTTTIITALNRFAGVKRRMELRGNVHGVHVYDDFAHHPTAIATTLHGLRKKVKQARIIAILEPRSNTMRMQIHQESLATSLQLADQIILYQPDNIQLDLSRICQQLTGKASVFLTIEDILCYIGANAKMGDHIVVMSNGGFGGIHERLLTTLMQTRE